MRIRPAPTLLSLAGGALAMLLSGAGQGLAAQEEALPPACSAGRISAIEIDTRPVFIAEDGTPSILRFAYGVGNLIHIETQESFVRSELLFKEGECLDRFLLSESARLLDAYGFLTEALIYSAPDGDGGHIVYVQTRDEWSTRLDLGVTYDDGLNLESFSGIERNFLGYGVNASARFRRRREEESSQFGISTPRLFGRTDAGMSIGEDRGGVFFNQVFSHGFVGETSNLSVSESFGRDHGIFSYTTGDIDGLSNVLVPFRSESFRFSIGTRWGEPGKSWILGADLTRDVRRRNGAVETVFRGDFGGAQQDTITLPPSVLDQLENRTSTRIALHIGTRRYRYQDVIGYDAVRERQTVGIGFFSGMSVGLGLRTLTAEGTETGPRLHLRSHSSYGLNLGASFIHGGVTIAAARGDAGWQDVLGEAEFIAYLRSRLLPAQTLFFRASAGGGWNSTIPFQVALGGREGVRSLRDDELPGAQRLVFILEDRIRFDWFPSSIGDLGMTLFADAGRGWAGDAPYGVDSEWYGSFGVGLRIALPSGSRNIWRPDIVFPIGREGSPVFRVTFELNRMRSGFVTGKVRRSYRFNRGPENF